VRKSKIWWIAVVLGGIAAACVPILLVEFSLNAYVERNARGKLELIARNALGLTVQRLEGAMATLVDLSAAGAEDCGKKSLDLMRRATTTSTPIKEISVLDESGATLCTNFGNGAEPRAISRELPLADRRFELALVRFRDRNDRALRLRFDRNGGKPLGALIPADLLVPETVEVDFDGGRSLRLVLDTEIVAARPTGDEGLSIDHAKTISVQMRAERFPVGVIVERTRATLAEEYRDLLTFGRIGSALITMLTFALFALYLRRSRGDPLLEFRAAIDNGEIIPYYQPTIDIKAGKVVGAEVLARWRRPDGTMVSPANFIPLAERSGLIYPMTRALMAATVQEMGEAYATKPNLNLAFNLYAGHFADETILDDLNRIFSGSKLAFSQIVLEVTEREPLPDLDLARSIIERMQQFGIRVAIDDVGTGHGGLSYLMKLGVDAIKIDKMFIDAINTERHSQTIIETLLELARTMKMEVIAEGVENFEQVEYLQRKGVHLAQGYVFAPPLPAKSYIALIEAAEPGAAAGDTPEAAAA
jgi:sensor c-di-GMP phosphodiesterase-like protein